MNKKHLFLLILILLNSFSFAQYVQVNSNCGFSLNGIPYKPLVCNYTIDFKQDANGVWYISPDQSYSSNWSNGDTLSPAQFIFAYDPTFNTLVNAPNNVSIAKSKLISDLSRIRSLGFTEIRICGAGFPKKVGLSDTDYFTLMDAFLIQVNNAGLKVIYLLSGGDFANNLSFKDFAKLVATRFSTNTTIMAYDLCNEPYNSLWSTIANDKYNFTKLYSEWSSCVKTVDQNHLITIGFQTPTDIFGNDPTLLPIDFVSFHFYPVPNSGLSDAKDLMKVAYYWCSKTITIPWIIGETSFSSNYIVDPGNYPNGTEANQKAYADYTLQQSVDCGCKGYSWWKYQNTHWGNVMEDNMGIYNNYSINTEGSAKLVASSFINYAGMTKNLSNCTIPSNYYTFANGTNGTAFTGYIKDNLGNSKPDAFVTLTTFITVSGATTYPQYSTFTDANGYFSIKIDGATITSLQVSLPGYSNVFQSTGSFNSGQNYELTKINNNSWVKEWSNSDVPNKITFFPNPSTKPFPGLTPNNWNLSDYDKFYKGDFNGDGRQDLLCVKYTNSSTTTDRMTILTYDNSFSIVGYDSNGDPDYGISSGWNLLWDNQSNSANGGGIYPYRNNLVVGDFNGDGTDDILGVSSWMTWFTFTPNANPTQASWYWKDSNYGTVNDPAHPMSGMAPYSSSVIAGKFYAGNNTAVIGVNTTNNWITSFQLVNGVWTWIQSNNGLTNNPNLGNEMSYLTPHKAQLIAGDFDGDGKAEVLGNALPSGAIAVFKPEYNGPTNTYKWNSKWVDNTNAIGMYGYRNNLVVGNFDADNNDEILGFETNFCVAFNFNTSNPNNYICFWEGSYNATISDWKINNTYAAKYLFLKTDINSKQQQLLAIRKNPSTNNYDANLYAYRPNVYTAYPCARMASINPEHNAIEHPTSADEISVYPNPNDGNFSFTLPVTVDKGSFKINIYNVEGKMEGFKLANSSEDNIINVKLDNLKKGIYFLQIITKEKVYSKKVLVF